MTEPLLRVTEGAEGRTLPLKVPFVIGSGEEASLRLSESGVAVRHLVVDADERGYFVDVLGTGAEATVNGGRLTGRRAVDTGDVLRIGEVRIEFLLRPPTTRRHKVQTAAVDTDRGGGRRSALEWINLFLHLINRVERESEYLEEVLNLLADSLGTDWSALALRSGEGELRLVRTLGAGAPLSEWRRRVEELLADGAGEVCWRSPVDQRPALYLRLRPDPDAQPVALCFARPAGSARFRKEEADLLEAIAAQLSDGMRLMRRVEETHRLQGDLLEIRDQERRRVGQDLHDGVCQELVGVGMLAKLFRRRLEGQGVEGCEELDRIIEHLEAATSHARALARGLSPLALEDEYGLLLALGELVDQTEQVFGLSCVFRCDEPVEVQDASVANHLYHLAREAVVNAAKHAQGSTIHVELREEAGLLTLTIDDDGRGLPTHGPVPRGMGLRVLEERARQLRARLVFDRSPLGGLRVRCAVPWQRDEGESFWLYAPLLGAPVLLHQGVRYTVGRTREADLRFPSSRVSRRHAEFRWEDGRWTLVDLGSTNGTAVNGEPLVGPRTLSSGDRLSFGGCEAVLRAGAAREDPAQLKEATQRLMPKAR